MNQAVMTSLFKDFFAQEVVAYTSDRSVDFKLQDGQTELTRSQKDFLTFQLGFRITNGINMKQVHGKIILKADGNLLPQKNPLVEADAVVTNQKNLPILTRTADCLPVFFHDPVKHCIAVAHAGWKGTQYNIVTETIAKMREFWGTDTKDVKVAFGPAIQKCCYEVGSEFKQIFPQGIVRQKGKDLLIIQALYPANC